MSALTPAFRDKENSDTCHSDENVEIMVQETSFKRQQNRHKPANESNSISDAGLSNVYIEITHDNMESSCWYCASHDNGNQDI